MVNLLIDNKKIEAEEGMTLLQICLDNEIYIPNLCYLRETESPHASCRMCFVEIEGEDKPVTSCTVKVKDGMVVRTDTQRVRQLQRTGFQLLLSVHDVKCKECPANKKCELQNIARFLKIGLKQKRLEQHLKETEFDDTHPVFCYYPNRCVLCGKCIHVCRKEHGQASMAFAKRGFDTIISFFGETGASASACEECTACVEICPVGAIVSKK
ncbi:MAG: 2Fe-2S iron-sulfur cluster binding domain-containing protein [Desulfobacteraceae bacterium]|nr:2Fe-2S iron-sulfur cluster binding domain-containing protein [Desulfobacteraceae bacterium]